MSSRRVFDIPPSEYVREGDILLAHSINGRILPPERGFPFRLVAEDRWGYKWIKGVTAIEVQDDAVFRGCWEQRGKFAERGICGKDFSVKSGAGSPVDGLSAHCK